MKVYKKLSVFIIAIAISATTAAQENPIEGKSGIGARFGYYQAADAEEGALFLGAQTRFRGKIIGLELAAEYRGKQTYLVSGGEIRVSQLPATVSVLGYIPIAPQFQPYGLIGAGAYYTFYDYDGFLGSAEDSEFNLGYHLGAGIEMPVNESAALHVDYRYLFLNGNNNDIVNKSYSGNVLTGGLTFYF